MATYVTNESPARRRLSADPALTRQVFVDAPVAPAATYVPAQPTGRVVYTSQPQVISQPHIIEDFDRRGNELERSEARVQQLNALIADATARLHERDFTISNLHSEAQLPADHGRIGQLQSEADSLRSRLHDVQNSTATLRRDRDHVQGSHSSHASRAQSQQQELSQIQNQIHENESKLQRLLTSVGDNQFGNTLRSFDEEQHAQLVMAARLQQMDADLLQLHAIQQQNAGLSTVLAQRDQELNVLRARVAEIESAEMPARLTGALFQKDSVVMQLRAELAGITNEFAKMKNANNVLMKKLVVLEDGYSSGDNGEDRSVDRQLANVQGGLSTCLRDLYMRVGGGRVQMVPVAAAPQPMVSAPGAAPAPAAKAATPAAPAKAAPTAAAMAKKK